MEATKSRRKPAPGRARVTQRAGHRKKHGRGDGRHGPRRKLCRPGPTALPLSGSQTRHPSPLQPPPSLHHQTPRLLPRNGTCIIFPSCPASHSGCADSARRPCSSTALRAAPPQDNALLKRRKGPAYRSAQSSHLPHPVLSQPRNWLGRKTATEHLPRHNLTRPGRQPSRIRSAAGCPQAPSLTALTTHPTDAASNSPQAKLAPGTLHTPTASPTRAPPARNQITRDLPAALCNRTLRSSFPTPRDAPDPITERV